MVVYHLEKAQKEESFSFLIIYTTSDGAYREAFSKKPDVSDH
jgi:hypothetical protein